MKYDDIGVVVHDSDFWQSKQSLELASRFWELTYGRGSDDTEVYRRILASQIEAHQDVEPDGISKLEVETSLSNPSAIKNLHDAAFLAHWAQYGYGHITMPHKFAAALMCSDTVTAIAQDINITWPAFWITVPNGILTTTAGNDFTSIHVTLGVSHALGSQSEEMFSICACSVEPRGIRRVSIQKRDFESLFAPTEGVMRETEEEVPEADQIERIALLVQRLVCGVLIHLDATAHLPTSNHGSQSHANGRTGPPKHRVTSIGSPVSVDCRSEVLRFIRGGRTRAPLAFQSLTRGHYKRQVVGVGRLGRKVIWIHPYWRGPEDAPILARPHKIGSQGEGDA